MIRAFFTLRMESPFPAAVVSAEVHASSPPGTVTAVQWGAFPNAEAPRSAHFRARAALVQSPGGSSQGASLGTQGWYLLRKFIHV